MPEISNLKYYSIVAALLLIAFGLCFLMIQGGIAFFKWTGYYIEHEDGIDISTVNTSIASLKDSSSIHGSFFLGCGGVSSRMYYVYYEGETSYRLKRVDVDDATIYMDEDNRPYISKITKRSRYKNGYGDISYGAFSIVTYEFHVPKGSIVTDYVLDSEV